VTTLTAALWLAWVIFGFLYVFWRDSAPVLLIWLLGLIAGGLLFAAEVAP